DDGRGDQVMNLDPWIVFWQIFEDRKRREQRLLADMTPPGPAQTGQTVQFSAAPSQPAEDADSLQYHWTFGDGSWAIGRDPSHRYAKPGIYPVTLVVTRGNESAARTMHLTVSGDPIDQPVLRIQADDPSFRIRPAWAANVYGQYTQPLPHTLRIHTHPGASTPLRRELQTVNIGSGTLSPLKVLSMEPDAAADWLRIETLGQGNNQGIRVTIDPTNLKPGDYASTVRVATQETMHAPQSFRVALHVHAEAPPADQIIGVQDAGFYATPWFWVGHRFSRAPADRRGHNGFYLTNGYRPTAGEFVRFTPHLADGTYEVSLLEKSPYPSDSEFNVRIRHSDGESLLRIRPSKSRSLGTYRFEVASPGFVELLAEDASGLLVADALRFRRVD
ncbi:MAG TPA: PKD domain-containing protein, partial [Phycisphaeraceae bacterium]